MTSDPFAYNGWPGGLKRPKSPTGHYRQAAESYRRAAEQKIAAEKYRQAAERYRRAAQRQAAEDARRAMRDFGRNNAGQLGIMGIR